jgi:phosphoglycolate phosphatase
MMQASGRKIDGIVFDKDGTLFDFRISWGRWAKGFLTALARDTDHAIQMGAAIGYDLRTGTFSPDSPVIAATAADVAALLQPFMHGASVPELANLIDEAAAGAEMFEAVPLRPLLSDLRRRDLRLGVATNDSEGPARAHLDAHVIAEFFDFIAGSDSGFGAKPGPGMCLAFARHVGLDPARVLMVGDSRHDLEAGRAAGMRTVAVLTGIATAADLAPHADAVLQDIGDLPQWMDTL